MTFADTDLFYFSSFILNHGFIKEDNRSENVAIVEEDNNIFYFKNKALFLNSSLSSFS